MKIDVIALVVTYGERHRNLACVIKSCLEEGVKKFVVVDNQSGLKTKEYLASLVKSGLDIFCITNEMNLGSSGGYKVGIEYLVATESLDSYFWFLDDDNMPETGSLTSLCNAYQYLRSIENKEIVLYSYRGETRKSDFELATYGFRKKYLKNNFCGFNASQTLINMVYRKFNIKDSAINYPLAKVEYGPWGGMFGTLLSLKKAGTPNADYFVYADDHEYSLRFNSLAIEQYLVVNSEVRDLIVSTTGLKRYCTSLDERELYLGQLYNHVYLGYSFVDRNYLYFANKLIYMIFLAYRVFFYVKFNFGRFYQCMKTILSTVSDAERAFKSKSDGHR